MSMLSDGMYLTPGITELLETTENVLWWGLREQQKVIYGPLSSTSLDSGNTPTDMLRAGLLLGRITASKKFVHWDPAAIDGSEKAAGVLLKDQKINRDGTATDRWVGGIMVGGNLKPGGVIISGQASAGITGVANEFYVRSMLTQTGRFILDDLYDGSPGGGWVQTVDLNDVGTGTPPSAYTITGADNNILFHTTGVTAAFTVTLPAATLVRGMRFKIYNTVDENLTVDTTTGDDMIVFNDVAADSVSLETAGDLIGGGWEFICLSATKWLVIPFGWGCDGVLVQTMTITT